MRLCDLDWQKVEHTKDKAARVDRGDVYFIVYWDDVAQSYRVNGPWVEPWRHPADVDKYRYDLDALSAQAILLELLKEHPNGEEEEGRPTQEVGREHEVQE